MSNEIIKVISLRGEVIENETLDNLKKPTQWRNL